MNCIILAAGKNIRLDNGKPKSLSLINGKSLLERHIKLFQKYGVDQFCVVIGYRGNVIKQHVDELSSAYNVKITCVENQLYELSNGHSLYAAKDWVLNNNAQEFLFVMADHYFEKEFIEKFITTCQLEADQILKLGVDAPGAHNKYIDLEDVTKVLAFDNKIKEIGKNLKEYNYFDTGLFSVKKAIFKILEQNFEEKKESISDMVQKIVNLDGSVISNISGFYWNDIDTPLDLSNTKNSVYTSEKSDFQKIH